MKAVLVDGPERGRIIETDRERVAFPRLRPKPIVNEFDLPFEPTFDEVVYHMHFLNFFGRCVAYGSVRPDEGHPADLFEALASNTVKDLVRL